MCVCVVYLFSIHSFMQKNQVFYVEKLYLVDMEITEFEAQDFLLEGNLLNFFEGNLLNRFYHVHNNHFVIINDSFIFQRS